MDARKTILIVDDNQINRQILTRILSEDYHILEAENGEIALKILRDKHEVIAVVLLDILMPVLDGYEVLRQMHADPLLAKVPVIVASGQNREDAEVKALSLGANDYILKPYKPEIIKHRVANTIYLRETAAFVNSVQQDSLTGLLSKDYFYLCVANMLRNNPDAKYDIICCDIERFKLVNDLYGIRAGDDLLKHIAALLSQAVSGHGICGRIGPDVFAMMIDHQPSYRNEFFAEAIEQINRYSVNLSIVLRYGIYTITDRTIPVNIMCDRACLAMESIKGKYDTYFSHYDAAVRQKLIDEQLITTDMKTALTEKRFEVYFQPKYELESEQIVGAEALVRWNNPQMGFLSPAEFIPLFEKNGFITDLDIYVWETCCQKIRAWIDEGHTPLPVSVNVSRADIYNPHIDRILLSLIKKYRLSPKYLYLEITETAYTENPEQLIRVINKLKKIGFVIEMDDFGTGYSSLNMLSELPIDVLKLDIKFIQNQELKKNSRSILSFIISLAKWLNLRVIAEGVETAEQVNLLRSLNCQYAQGYFFAQPMQSDKFEEMLRRLEALGKEKKREKPLPKQKKRETSLKTMIVLDHGENDFEPLREAFEENYALVEAKTTEEALDVIEKQKTEVAVILLHFDAVRSPGEIEMLDNLCKLYNIPLLTIHDSPLTIEEAMKLSVSDYIQKPYRAGMLKNRIENAICRSQIVKFEKEKEINLAILEMKKRAEEDPLTGLLNRAEFETRIGEFFHNNYNPEGIFIILDVDNFKKINDTFGHLTGDHVLQSIADQLNALFPETEIISRMGGDEFALFIPYSIGKKELDEKLSKLCHAMRFDVEHIEVSCSAGVCLSPECGMDYEELYSNSDIALLTAKRNGKNQYRIFAKGMEASGVTQLENKAAVLLDDVSDAMFVCDAGSNEVVYINDTACQIIHKDKKACIGAHCYQLFWDRCRNCDRCFHIDDHTDHYYEEDTFLKDGVTKVHIKAKMGDWDGKAVKIHYLQGIELE